MRMTTAISRTRVAKHKLPLTVLHNNDLNQVTWEVRARGGTPKFTESQALPDVDLAAFAVGSLL